MVSARDDRVRLSLSVFGCQRSGAPLDLCITPVTSPTSPPHPITPFPLLATGRAGPGSTSLGRYSRSNTSTFTPKADVSSALSHITVPLKLVKGDITPIGDTFKQRVACRANAVVSL
jgi:hypothetical protein